MTQARANWINPPRWARSLPRQFPPPIGGVMQLSFIGTPGTPSVAGPNLGSFQNCVSAHRCPCSSHPSTFPPAGIYGFPSAPSGAACADPESATHVNVATWIGQAGRAQPHW